jgi:hypothetical protein
MPNSLQMCPEILARMRRWGEFEFGFTPTQNYGYRSGAHHPGVGTIVILLSSAAPAVARQPGLAVLKRAAFAGGHFAQRQ